jgi:hypothetical protein
VLNPVLKAQMTEYSGALPYAVCMDGAPPGLSQWLPHPSALHTDWSLDSAHLTAAGWQLQYGPLRYQWSERAWGLALMEWIV